MRVGSLLFRAAHHATAHMGRLSPFPIITMELIAEIKAQASAIQTIRRDIHAHPEVGYDVFRTSDLVASLLEGWGIAVTRQVGKTGVVGTLRRGSGDRAIGLRADMDALPVQELNDFAHRSTVPGAMHACGHDGHTAMLLGAAQYLAKYGDFNGTVQFIFQPADSSPKPV
ncbi:amidohydrolase [Paraburkholderia youngii]